MRISCPHCGATGTVRDALVPEGGRVVACPKCRSNFTVNKESPRLGSARISPHTHPDGKIPVCCPTCGTTGSLPAARIGAVGTTVTCPKCKAKFAVKGDAPSAPTAPGEKVPVACPQCGGEGELAGSLVPEGGIGTNCPGCNTRFFVRRQDESKTGSPTGLAYGGVGHAASASSIHAGPSVAVGTHPLPSAPSYRSGPSVEPGRPKAAVSGRTVAPDDIWSEPSVTRAVMGGAGAALVGAMIWAFITVMTSFQIGWMAIGVGALVGFAVKFFGRGTDQTFGFIGAGLALFGCAIGNLMAACAFISTDPRNADIGFISIFFDALFSPPTAARIMGATFHPLDLLFYVLAVSTGYKVALSRE